MEILDDRSVIYQLEVYKKWYEEQQEEIERLNNIIDELEVELLTDSALYVNAPEIRQIYIDIYEKLKELKGEN